NRTVLVIEDEPALSDAIRYSLERDGYRVYVADDGLVGIELMRTHHPDVVLLDLMLPSLSGLDVLRTLRTISSVPVIIVTAKDGEGDKVAGLELGADDYVTKPFSMRELVARVGANVRRSAVQVDASDVVLVGGDVKLDVGRHVTTVRGREVELRPKEFALLELLLLRGGKVVTRDDLIAEVWGYDYFGDTKTLDVHIKRLRSKIEIDPKHPQHIVTVRGMGYKFSL
ncbi:MAG: response regulator transcription factor, partial [Acidimicrobiia bacterium]|nr:response regulator transcription factor [Acidimicrobiia bacterium]